jgi:hypothetical protein
LYLDDWERLKVEPFISELQNYICRVSPRWNTIGIQLEIPLHVLDEIGTESDPTIRCTKIIRAWRRNANPPFLWATFIEVLAKESIGEHALAHEIATDILKKYVSY